MELYLRDYEQLKKVENFLFRFIYPESFTLQIFIKDTNDQFNYETIHNDLAGGLVLVTF
jgi:hypothetical protein